MGTGINGYSGPTGSSGPGESATISVGQQGTSASLGDTDRREFDALRSLWVELSRFDAAARWRMLQYLQSRSDSLTRAEAKGGADGH